MEQVSNQTKILSIADENSTKNVDFIEKLEKEKNSIKLYYYIWLSRFYIFCATVSLIFFMSASLSLFKLAPNVFVEPLMIMGPDDSAGVVRAEAMTDNMASKDKMLEIFMRNYVIIRNSIIPDDKEMQTRWMPGGMMNFLSSYPIFAEFSKNRETILKNAVAQKLSRTVQIDSIGKVGGDKSPVWKVNFTTFDLSPSDVQGELGAMRLTSQKWTASISAKFYDNRLFMGRRLLNPLGFTVISYSQAPVISF